MDDGIGTRGEYDFVTEVVEVYTYFVHILKAEEEGYISLYNMELGSANRGRNGD